MRKLLVALVVALGIPAGANSAGYVALTIDPTKVAPGWTLSGTVESTAVSASRFGSEDLKLRRTFLGGRGEEEHRLHAATLQNPISFDGQTGRWRTSSRFGNTAAADVSIRTLALPVPFKPPRGCRGEFARVPVLLTGRLSIRTGTQFFQTIRRTRLSGFVVFERGHFFCESGSDEKCEPPSALALYAGSPRASVLAFPRRLIVELQDPLPHRGSGEVLWHHVLTISGYDAMTGKLPRLEVRAPATSAVRGNARFLASEPTLEYEAGNCRSRLTRGSATGRFTATFVGWGARTLLLEPGDNGLYEEKR